MRFLKASNGDASRVAKQSSSTQKAKAQKKSQKTVPKGWLTTDADEIERRRQRGRGGHIQVEPLAPEQGVFATFLVRSAQEQIYHVEIRSLTAPFNTCECADHRVNGLGTCKHVEAVIAHLENTDSKVVEAAKASGSPWVEIFLDRRDEKLRIAWPQGVRQRSRLHKALSPFFSADGALLAGALEAVPALQRTVEGLSARLRRQVRFSREIEPWRARLQRAADHQRAREQFEADVAAGKRSLDVVRHPLYSYQQEGMLHLAFKSRALLGDEMGLGKTVQAVAACELLRRLHGIERVLVISPASLKAEWEEQIAKFTGLSSIIVQGSRDNRLRRYRDRAFFYLANYEQILADGAAINRVLCPDVIILDEAQRIKNWQTKTADAVKRLHSPYAFVLTGTPIENRIDEIYSIVQFLDPHLFGPLFRFNRDFYQLDANGRPVGYKNLDELNRRLRPIMLRRRKEEVEGELPGLTVNTYFVDMTPEQRDRYEDYEARVARLAAIAKQRPLTAEEMDRLQRSLACMRMLCDTPYILDPDVRVSPKLDELANILGERLEDDSKILIFSEWERMLELVAELAEQMGVGYAWHTGSVSQPQRRAEIHRFKNDPDCRLFLATESGGTGLNLQAASWVINIDLPWNPAKLEQRIARAWRKHQQHPVQVINLVCENSLEHRILHLLEQKRDLARGVIDGFGDIKDMALPSGRTAFMERVGQLIGEGGSPTEEGAQAASSVAPAERLRQDVVARWRERLDVLEIHDNQQGGRTLVAVADKPDEGLRSSLQTNLQTAFPEATPDLELLDRATYETMQRLIAAGVVSPGNNTAQTLHQSPSFEPRRTGPDEQRLAQVRQILQAGKRQQRMAQVLRDGGFPVEALMPLREAVESALRALAELEGQGSDEAIPLDWMQPNLVATGLLSEAAVAVVAQLRSDGEMPGEDRARTLAEEADALVAEAAKAIDNAGDVNSRSTDNRD